MEGPKIAGPSIWLDSIRITETKILDFVGHTNDRFKWLDEFTEECKRKLGVEPTKEPTFAPKTPGKKKKGAASRKSDDFSPITAKEAIIKDIEETNLKKEATQADSLNETKTRSSRRTKNDVSVLDNNPVPKPRASKRTRQLASSASSQSSESTDEKEEPSVKKSPANVDASASLSETHAEEIVTEVVNSTIIVSKDDDNDKTFEVPETNTVVQDEGNENVFIEAEAVNKPSAVDAVRSLLASVENSFSPIAAPRRSFRNLDQESSEVEESNKTPKKPLLNDSNSKLSSVSSEDLAADETVTVENSKRKSKSRSRGSQSSAKGSVTKSSCSEVDEAEAVAVIDAP